MTIKSTNKSYIAIGVVVHVIVWLYIFLSPLIYQPPRLRTFEHLLHPMLFNISLCVVFYVNYFILAEKYYLRKKYTRFVLTNIGLLVFLAGIEQISNYLLPIDPFEPKVVMNFHRQMLMQMRGMISYAAIAAFAVLMTFGMKWRRAESVIKEIELQKTESEIKALKYQINPHFLLNTLNNIYALTGMDTNRAQTAIQQLSHLLRYLLYDTEAPKVSLRSEIAFLKNYIELMRIRLDKSVEVVFTTDVPPKEDYNIAPLIFVSLVENAFKHGIRPLHKSWVHINLTANNDGIHFKCSNSNFPKDKSDKTPSGIGLQQVKRRLELSYPNHFQYNNFTTDNENTYIAEIIIENY